MALGFLALLRSLQVTQPITTFLSARCVQPKNEMYVRVRAPSVATHALPDAVFHQKWIRGYLGVPCDSSVPLQFGQPLAAWLYWSGHQRAWRTPVSHGAIKCQRSHWYHSSCTTKKVENKKIKKLQILCTLAYSVFLIARAVQLICSCSCCCWDPFKNFAWK